MYTQFFSKINIGIVLIIIFFAGQILGAEQEGKESQALAVTVGNAIDSTIENHKVLVENGQAKTNINLQIVSTLVSLNSQIYAMVVMFPTSKQIDRYKDMETVSRNYLKKVCRDQLTALMNDYVEKNLEYTKSNDELSKALVSYGQSQILTIDRVLK